MAWRDSRSARTVEELDRLMPVSLAEQFVRKLQLSPSRMPDARLHNPDITYLQRLAFFSGLSRAEIARRLGVGVRSVERYLSDNPRSHIDAPYLFQFGLERLLIRRAELNRVARMKRANLARFSPDE